MDQATSTKCTNDKASLAFACLCITIGLLVACRGAWAESKSKKQFSTIKGPKWIELFEN